MKNTFQFLTLIFLISSFVGKSQHVSSGKEHSLFLKNDGTVWGAGLNNHGQLGTGNNVSTDILVHISSLSDIIAVDAGADHSLFLKSDGTVWSTGENSKGQLGLGFSSSWEQTPVQISSLSDVIAIAAGHYHSLFLKSDGTVWCTGQNDWGQLGNGFPLDSISLSPVQITSLTGIVAISAGNWHSLFVKNDGTAWGAGSNSSGQLGDGTTMQRSTPVQVSSMTDVISVSGGFSHSMFLKNNGTAWGVGYNWDGQLGDGTTSQRTTPVQVSSLSGVKSIVAGHYHSMYLKTDSTVWGSGKNDSGQLGDSTTNSRSTPVRLRTVRGALAIGGGNGITLIATSTTFYGSGKNDKGQLGNGSTTNTSTATEIATAVSARKRHIEEVDFYPNPVENQFQISVSAYNGLTAEVYTLSGQLLLSRSLQEEQTTIDMSEYSNGTYIITVKSTEEILVSKFVKR